MNLEEIEERLRRIDALKRDAERAHAAEDGLVWDFVEHVAAAQDPRGLPELARAVLKSRDIQFGRWTA